MRSLMLASLFLLCTLAGCGGSSTGDLLIDAAVPGTPDARVYGPIMVSVYHVGAPVAGAKVVTQRSDGSVLNAGTTDANGTATVEGIAGGYATALWQDQGGNFFIYTFAAVAPGDDLRAKIIDPRSANTPNNQINVTISNTYAGATVYGVTDVCASDTATGVGTFQLPNTNPSCADPNGKWSVLARAVGAAGTLGYQSARDVASGATVALNGTWSNQAPYTVTFTNAPANSAGALITEQLDIGGVKFNDAFIAGPIAPTAGTTLNARVPTSSTIADAVIVDTVLRFQNSGGRVLTSQHILRTTPAPTVGPGPSMDMAATLLPRVHDPGLNSVDLNHIVASFQADGSLATADASGVTFSWNDGSKNHVWATLFPANTTVTLPTLPSDASAWGPLPAYTLNVNFAAVIDLSTTNGYNAFRQVANRNQNDLPTSTASLRLATAALP